MLAAQVQDHPDAANYLRWLDWGLWTLLAICVAAVIAGGATAVLSGPNQTSRTWGLRMVAAGLAGALVAPLLSQLIRFFWGLIVGDTNLNDFF